MGAEIFSVGSELLLGQILDTNAAFLSQELSRLGIDCFHKTSVGDNLDRLVGALRVSLARADLIVTSGGLGPTQDDVTAAGIAQALGVGLVCDESCEKAVRAALEGRGIKVLASHMKQARLPQGATPVPNSVGTAPGFIARKGNKTIIALPGPPAELKPMFLEHAVPVLRKSEYSQGVIESRLLRFMGIGESALEETLSDLIEAQSNPTLAPLAGASEVKLRITAKAATREEAEALIAPVEQEVMARAGEYLAGRDESDVAATAASRLTEKGLTLALAESCTGGLIAHRLTEMPGASRYLLAGWVTYSNASKTAFLGVDEGTLKRHGAVSREAALQMARGAREAAGADFGLSTTGIAGPTGGTKTKPVGLVYIAVCGAEGEVCEEHRFRGPRGLVKERAAMSALNLLRKQLARKPQEAAEAGKE